MITKEEVLKLAEAAEVGTRVFVRIDDLAKLIELAQQAGAAEEREACAKLCERMWHPRDISLYQNAIQSCANAIRNRESNL